MKKILVFSGPSGVGKTTLKDLVLKEFSRFVFSVSATSRPPRKGEIDGVDYYFLGGGKFDEKIRIGDFVEWEEVYPGTKYGTLKSDIKRILGLGKIPLLDIDVRGGIKMKEIYGDDVLTIIVCPPNLEVLKERLKGRETETEESFKKRVSKAEYELSFKNQFDLVLVNNTLEESMSNLRSTIIHFFD